MVKTVVNVDGMMCGMCEAHVQDAVRKAVPSAQKVKADHGKGIVSFVTDDPVEEEPLKSAIDATGYYYRGIRTEDAESKPHKGLFGKFRK